MESAELRAVQQPLKDAYRDNPEKAVVTLQAHGQLDDAMRRLSDAGASGRDDDIHLTGGAAAGPGGCPVSLSLGGTDQARSRRMVVLLAAASNAMA